MESRLSAKHIVPTGVLFHGTSTATTTPHLVPANALGCIVLLSQFGKAQTISAVSFQQAMLCTLTVQLTSHGFSQHAFSLNSSSVEFCSITLSDISNNVLSNMEQLYFATHSYFMLLKTLILTLLQKLGFNVQMGYF